ncbi:MAG TPA: rhomboid family intramembrane serine protease [Candidatus Obscuribacter sp.]|nr:rhomboid family intramembrane serine protease [Candidatus Obscuribacter sp.]
MLPIADDNPTTSYPVINHLLIFFNLAAFVAQILFLADVPTVGKLLSDDFSMVPARFLSQFSLVQFGTLFSSMFMHAGFSHIFGNLWYLYIFGDNVEDRMGHTNYLLFYLACGVLADVAHIISDPSSTVPCVGASGAISGVLGAYLVLFPGVKVRTWVTWYWHPMVDAWVLIGFWFVLQCISSMLFGTEGGGVAWYAHIGGFIGGILLLRIVVKQAERRRGGSYDVSERNLPLPTFIAVSLVLYGLVAIGMAAYKHTAFTTARIPFLPGVTVEAGGVKKPPPAEAKPAPAVSPAAGTSKTSPSPAHTQKHHSRGGAGSKGSHKTAPAPAHKSPVTHSGGKVSKNGSKGE